MCAPRLVSVRPPQVDWRRVCTGTIPPPLFLIVTLRTLWNGPPVGVSPTFWPAISSWAPAIECCYKQCGQAVSAGGRDHPA
ncbi:hypothetical protein MAHJHV63_47450 [Mycobacterium avium subsp. hominissuis]